MNALPFYIGNFLSCFIINGEKRHKIRGDVNFVLYKKPVARVIKRIFCEKAQDIKFIRQHTPSRFVCLVNDKYFVKIFKYSHKKRLKNFEFLVNYVCNFMDVNIPKVYISNDGHTYVTEKIPGQSIYAFDKEFVLKHEKQILQQSAHIISQIQSIDLNKIPNAQRFTIALEKTSKKTKPEKITNESVLAHLDLNVRNFLFDENLNICGLVDFDSMSITNDKNKDMQIFMKYWERYKKSIQKHPL